MRKQILHIIYENELDLIGVLKLGKIKLYFSKVEVSLNQLVVYSFYNHNKVIGIFNINDYRLQFKTANK